MNSINNTRPEKSDYKTMRKDCYQRNLHPNRADNQFKEKYGYFPPIAWASNCCFNQKRKMTTASQLKFARYCLRHTSSADEAIEMMQIEVGIGARWEEYKRKFLTCVREWESRVSLNIESLHASKGWRYKKFDIYHASIKTPHHEYLEEDDIYILNDLVSAWEVISTEEQNAEKERVEQSLFEENSSEWQARRKQAEQQMNRNAKTRCKATSEYQQKQRYEKDYSRYRKKPAKEKSPFVSSKNRFLKGKYHTVTELKTAYRKLSKELHPDTGGNEEDFRKLLDEYQTLKSQFN